jgi:gluconate 5-dehydrogenase
MEYKNLFNLKDKVAVVTGGNGYIGQEIVKGLLEFGATVVVLDIKNSDFDSNYYFIKCDLNNSNEIEESYYKIENIYGGIDILIACAAYTGYAGTGKTEDISDDEWEKGINGTLNITFKAIKKIIPFFRRRKSGNIVTFGSLYSWIAPDFRIYGENNISPPNYGSGKAGIIQLTRHVASQYANENIRVNSITPGSYPHPQSFSNKDFILKLSSRNMMNRIGFPQDLVGAILFFVSDASRFVTGSNINVDGGQLSW